MDNSTIDRWGYGVTSALSPYHENRIALDINDLENDVELKSTSAVAVPRQGSVVFADFETVQGQSAIMNITRSMVKIFHLLQIFMMSKAMSLVMLDRVDKHLFVALSSREISALNGSKKVNP